MTAWQGLYGLTVRQPYASLIAYGVKGVENRTRPFSYRGDLLIHAGREAASLGDGEAPDLAREWARTASARGLAVPFGSVIAVVRVADCHPDGGCCRPWGESSYVEAGGRRRGVVWHHVYEDVRRLSRPVPWVGSQGFWRVPIGLAANVYARVA